MSENDHHAGLAAGGNDTPVVIPQRQAAAHAATPWHLGPHYRTDIMNRQGFVAECRPMQTEYAEANAEFIVRACNSHEDLLAALKALIFPMEAWNDAVEQVTGEQPVVNDALTRARAAIQKAEGKP